MNDQISTAGAGHDVISWGQCWQAEVVREQRSAGRFFDFSLTHPARFEGAVVQQRERPCRYVAADQAGLVSVSTPQSSDAGCAAKRSRIDSGFERPVTSNV
jgi:hypothetical protein